MKLKLIFKMMVGAVVTTLTCLNVTGDDFFTPAGGFGPGFPKTAEEAYAQKWTRKQLEETYARSSEWMNNNIGKGKYAPPPWTPMEVDGENVKCWGRIYQYKDSILPIQIISQDKGLFARPPVFVLNADGKNYEFRDAVVKIEKVHAGLINVKAVSSSGPYTLELRTGYEFDGMGKVEMKLVGEKGTETVDSLYLHIPLKSESSILSNYTPAYYFDRRSDSKITPAEGVVLDEFCEILWLGDQKRGFTWFAESLENWSLKDEKKIQAIGPVNKETRDFSIKLADKRFVLSAPYELVFGIQATPMKPRPDNFRTVCLDMPRDQKQNVLFPWWWSDLNYSPTIDTNPEKAREQVLQERAAGREFMANVLSLEYIGTARFFATPRGLVKYPGMIQPELLIWGNLWTKSYIKLQYEHYKPENASQIKQDALKIRKEGIPGGMTVDELLGERHTNPGKWFGADPRKGSPFWQPSAYMLHCVNSSSGDWLIWKLDELVKNTGLRAIYMDQQFRACANPEHGCGYIDYNGAWRAEAPLFAMRDVIKRAYFLFYERNGVPPLVKWHSSLQMIIPVISFVDINMEGEAYATEKDVHPRGVNDVYFHSKILDEGIMQVAHMGQPFGFAPVYMPQMKRHTPFFAPTPASVRDIMGLMMIHDSNVHLGESILTYPNLGAWIQNKRLSYPLEKMKVIYYWEQGMGIKVGPKSVKYIMHYNDEQALMILFNWGDETVLADVELDFAKLGVGGRKGAVNDALNDCIASADANKFSIDILPRDFRILEIKWKDETRNKPMNGN